MRSTATFPNKGGPPASGLDPPVPPVLLDPPAPPAPPAPVAPPLDVVADAPEEPAAPLDVLVDSDEHATHEKRKLESKRVRFIAYSSRVGDHGEAKETAVSPR